MDPVDARKPNAVLTPTGEAYADAVVEAIDTLYRQIAAQASTPALEAADAVLRVAITGGDLRRRTDRVPDPSGTIPRRPVAHMPQTDPSKKGPSVAGRPGRRP